MKGRPTSNKKSDIGSRDLQTQARILCTDWPDERAESRLGSARHRVGQVTLYGDVPAQPSSIVRDAVLE